MKQSTPLSNFNERSKLAAIKCSQEKNSARRTQSAEPDTETSNRSILIFDTPEPQPTSIQVFNIETDSQDEQSYQVITSNNPEDFMETSSISPRTLSQPLIAETSTLEDSTESQAPANSSP